MKINRNIIAISLVISFLGLWQIASAQYTNSWINYNQSYYRFKVLQDGIYRITYNDMLNAGIPASSINPLNFQIFGRGQEQYIYVYNQVQGIMGPGDYIEFYGQRNDGWYDTALYIDPTHQPNKGYSLFTDTAVYYLTWNNLFNNKRLTPQTDVNFASYQVASSVYKVSYVSFSDAYMEGMPIRESLEETFWNPEYAEGEGFYGYPFYLGGSRVHTVPTKNALTSGNADIKFLLHGASNFKSLNYDHHVRIQFAGIQVDTIFEGYKVLNFQYSIPASSLGSTNTSFNFSSINDLGSQADRNAVAFIEIGYPHSLDFEGSNRFDFFVDDATQSKAYLNISNFSGGNNPVLYDLQNHNRIKVVKNGNAYQALVPNGGGRKSCVLVSESSIISGVSLTPVGANAKFKNYLALNPDADYIIISHASLMNSSGALSGVNDYAAYRISKGFDVMVVDINDLYEQFSYGISKNPLAIRNFMRYAHHQLQSPPEHLFVIGKAYYPQEYRKNPTYFSETLVPSWGSPPSDILLVSYIVDSTYKTSVGIGRLSASNLDHVDLYLEKVILHEDPLQNPRALWRKKALFFSGGSDAQEQSLLAGYMKGYEEIFEDTSYGGSVQTFYKTSTDPIQVNLSEAIKKLINNGIGMLNFFGHAAGIGFDISIDNPAEYSNYGKYPFLIANSCFAGDIFQPNTGVVNSSEAFILIRNKGAIAYLGSVTPGVPAYLNLYTKSFFRNYSSLSYNESIGQTIKNTIYSIYSNYASTREIIFEMTLHGDPAVKMGSSEYPDYEINESSFYTNPDILTTEVDSFKVNLIVSNLGMAVNDSIVIEFQRILPNLTTKQLKSIFIRGVRYQDTLSVWFPVNKYDDLGKNTLVVRVDANSSVTEMDEMNNMFTYYFDIKAADLKPVYPAEFAIIPNQNPTLSASTFYPFSGAANYVFQIDTTVYFNSPLLETAKVNSIGGVVEYTVNQIFVDSLVYYWRVSLDSTSAKGYNWRLSSFQYIPFTTGWSQSHFFQFENNLYRFAVFNKPMRTFEFVNDVKVVKCINGIWPHIAWNMPQYLINNVQYSYAGCVGNGIKIAVINPISGDPWFSHYNGTVFGDYGNYHCKNYDYASFEFSTESFPPNSSQVSDTVWFNRMADFIGKIPDGYYVLARSHQNSNITKWPENLYKAFDSLGANFHRNIPDNRPYIVWGVKGNLGNALEMIGDSVEAHQLLVDSFNTKWTEGTLTTPIIGPTTKWNSLFWNVRSQETVNTDEVSLMLLGIKATGQQDTIIAALPVDSSTISQLNNRMPADIYPYCKIVLSMKDDSLHTPPYINNLQLLYTEVPELAVDPKTKYAFHSDTIEKGDTMKIEVAYRNISNVNLADSLLVQYWLLDNNLIQHDLGTKRIKAIQANSFLVDSFSLPTKNLVGHCSFFLEINPVNPLTSVYDQLELTHINNTLEVPFVVVEDKSNPLLDITFDGIHILDGDIVSAKPEIVILLMDDNKYVAIDDTSLFTIYLTSPGNTARKRVYFYSNGVEQLQFIPSQLPENKAKVIFRPDFFADGEYILYVQAVDPTLNISGIEDYQISFMVINKNTVTSLMNWPNPFTTKTHFVFTLTGSQLPDYMLIQIMTISGKVVREITMDELGPIHIGRNITEFAWDGTDSYGDRLANGIYLYRVITKLNGEEVEHNQTAADQYFNRNFGKMYLIR